jgi:hypothetical protein
LKRPESEEKMYDQMNMMDEDVEDDEEHIIEALEKKMVVNE